MAADGKPYKRKKDAAASFFIFDQQ